MAYETIYYKDRTGVQTKDILRDINSADQNWLKTVMACYLALEYVDSRELFAQWFNTPNEYLPKQPKHNNQYNSPKSFAEGIIDKLNQKPNRRDLSPKQCDGIEQLSKQMATIYNDSIPSIKFCHNMHKKVPASQVNFKKLFNQMLTGNYVST